MNYFYMILLFLPFYSIAMNQLPALPGYLTTPSPRGQRPNSVPHNALSSLARALTNQATHVEGTAHIGSDGGNQATVTVGVDAQGLRPTGAELRLNVQAASRGRAKDLDGPSPRSRSLDRGSGSPPEKQSPQVKRKGSRKEKDPCADTGKKYHQSLCPVLQEVAQLLRVISFLADTTTKVSPDGSPPCGTLGKKELRRYNCKTIHEMPFILREIARSLQSREQAVPALMLTAPSEPNREALSADAFLAKIPSLLAQSDFDAMRREQIRPLFEQLQQLFSVQAPLVPTPSSAEASSGSLVSANISLLSFNLPNGGASLALKVGVLSAAFGGLMGYLARALRN